MFAVFAPTAFLVLPPSLLGCYALWSWSKVYRAPIGQLFNPRYNVQLDKMSSTCVQSLEQALEVTGYPGSSRTISSTPTSPDP